MKKIDRRGFFFFAFLFMALVFIGERCSFSAFAATPEQKIPYFTHTKAKKVNVRKGAGPKYPIEAVLTIPQPVEVIGKNTDIWIKIKDWEGMTGWVQKNLLSTKKRLGITTQDTLLYNVESPQTPIARAQKGTIVKIQHCDGITCRVSAERDNITGYLPQDYIFGVYKGEVIK